MLKTYTHHCNGTCGERLDQQQKTIKAKNLYISRQSAALDKASKRIVELEKKEKAWDEFVEYFDSVVSEEGFVSDTDENIVVAIQNIRMNHHFKEESE